MRAWIVMLTSTFALGAVLGGCGAKVFETCRLHPEDCPGGEAGAFCDKDSDCAGFCCKDNGNCDGGMCTYECDVDADCPPTMACEHDMCFYLCDHDSDCASGQSCEHGNTICEW